MKDSYKKQYEEIAKPALKKQFKYSNDLSVPRIRKVVINIGIGRILAGAKNSEETLKHLSENLALITGQQPAIRPSRTSISNFKVRQGMPVGLKVTLRGKRMEDFIYKFINIVLPRVRDFWGLALKNIDEKGNLSYGIKDCSVFPEISKDNLALTTGLEITFVVKARNREESIELFKNLGFPLEKN